MRKIIDAMTNLWADVRFARQYRTLIKHGGVWINLKDVWEFYRYCDKSGIIVGGGAVNGQKQYIYLD